MRKQAQGGCVAVLERERKIAIRLLITGSGVRVPHNPLVGLTCGTFSESRRCIHLIEKGYTARYGCIPTISSHLEKNELKPGWPHCANPLFFQGLPTHKHRRVR